MSVRADTGRTEDFYNGEGAMNENVLAIDGSEPISAELVARVEHACDRATAPETTGHLVLRVGGVPRTTPRGLSVTVVSRWEKSLRRLERLPVPTIAIAEADCGGTALEALLAADYRVAAPTVRLIMPLSSGATWPGMGLYRLANQGTNSAAVRRAVLFGEPISAAAAEVANLVDEVTDDPAEALARAAARTAGLSGAEMAVRRQLLLEATTTSYEESLGAHLAACDRELRRAAAGAAV